MIDKVSEAIRELSQLSAAEQELAADAILDFAHRSGRPALTDEQADEVRRRLADPVPKFITLAEARARLIATGN